MFPFSCPTISVKMSFEVEQSHLSRLIRKELVGWYRDNILKVSTNGLERQSVSVRIRTIVWTTRLVVKILNWFEAKRIKFFFICNLPRSSPLFTFAIHYPYIVVFAFPVALLDVFYGYFFIWFCLGKKLLTTSVTRWLHYFFNIWQFTKMKIWQ